MGVAKKSEIQTVHPQPLCVFADAGFGGSKDTADTIEAAKVKILTIRIREKSEIKVRLKGPDCPSQLSTTFRGVSSPNEKNSRPGGQ